MEFGAKTNLYNFSQSAVFFLESCKIDLIHVFIWHLLFILLWYTMLLRFPNMTHSPKSHQMEYQKFRTRHDSMQKWCKVDILKHPSSTSASQAVEATTCTEYRKVEGLDDWGYKVKSVTSVLYYNVFTLLCMHGRVKTKSQQIDL